MTQPPGPDADDVALVRSIAGGDAVALARAYDVYGGWVTGIALRIVGNAAEAEEVAQEVFVQLWRAAGRFDAERGTLHGWLVTIARTRAIDRLRARARRIAAGEGALVGVEARGPGPVESLSFRDARQAALSAMEGLPVEERRVLELAYFDGLSQTEIAERTSTPLGTVKGRARNALARLRSVLPRSLGGDR